jgi:hypothetical protein
MAKNDKRIGRDAASGRFVGEYRVLGTTRDGVKILKPKARATHFTDREMREAVRATLDSQKAK